MLAIDRRGGGRRRERGLGAGIGYRVRDRARRAPRGEVRANLGLGPRARGVVRGRGDVSIVLAENLDEVHATHEVVVVRLHRGVGSDGTRASGVTPGSGRGSGRRDDRVRGACGGAGTVGGRSARTNGGEGRARRSERRAGWPTAPHGRRDHSLVSSERLFPDFPVRSDRSVGHAVRLRIGHPSGCRCDRRRQPILFQPERGVGQNDIFSPAACHTRRPSRGDEVFASRRVDPYRERTLDASDVRSRPHLRVAAPRHPSSRGNFLLFLTDGRSFPRARAARRPHAAHGEARASRVRPRSVDEPRRGGERGRRRDSRARHQRVHQAQGPEAVLGVRAVGSTAILRG